MSLLTGAVPSPPIQVEEVQFKAAVSEYTIERLGAAVNVLINGPTAIAKFNLNGAMTFFTNKFGADGIFVVPWNAYIMDVVIIGGRTAGASGTTQFDVQVSSFPSGAFTSIFSTQPSLNTTAAAFATCRIGQTVTGATPAVLTSSPNLYVLNQDDRIGIEVTSAMGGQLDGSIELWLQMR